VGPGNSINIATLYDFHGGVPLLSAALCLTLKKGPRRKHGGPANGMRDFTQNVQQETEISGVVTRHDDAGNLLVQIDHRTCRLNESSRRPRYYLQMIHVRPFWKYQPKGQRSTSLSSTEGQLNHNFMEGEKLL
jgi:hypothetical protein